MKSLLETDEGVSQLKAKARKINLYLFVEKNEFDVKFNIFSWNSQFELIISNLSYQETKDFLDKYYKLIFLK